MRPPAHLAAISTLFALFHSTHAAPFNFFAEEIAIENDAFLHHSVRDIEIQDDSQLSPGISKRNFDAAGNGITFPTTAQPLSLGQSYVFKFITANPVNWDTITVDLYFVQDQQYFVTNLVQIDPSEALDPRNALAASIPVTIPVSVGTGSLYIVKIYGKDKGTGLVFSLPDSSSFSIVNPYGGEWNHPATSDVWFTGRTSVLNFVLGSQFVTAQTMRLEATGITFDRTVPIVQSIPITPSMTLGFPSTLSLNIPICFDASLAFYVRFVPNDGPFASPANRSLGALSQGYSLPSDTFILYTSALLTNYNLLLNITLPTLPTPLKSNTITSLFISTPVTLTWRYMIPKPGVSNWNVDLYSCGDTSAHFAGMRVLTGSAVTQFTWTPDQTVPAGLYYFRVWGYASGSVVTDQVDAVSQISGVFTVVNPVMAPVLKITALAAPNWNLGCRANVTWNVTQTTTGTDILGWEIDLYQNSKSFKFVQTLTNTSSLPANTTWTLVQIPLNIPTGFDYFVRVRALLDPLLYPNQDVGNITSWFKINQAPPVASRNSTVANFAENVQRPSGNGTSGQQTGNPNPFPNRGEVGVSVAYALGLVGMVFAFTL
ncbi:hypothetical protein HDU98_005777 [Podochytrium sp. JEL0797]|nr:hypothetical protein HDU98_005777 [Podochytrium sp. JEL0797]